MNNRNIIILACALLTALLVACSSNQPDYSFNNDGRDRSAPQLPQLYSLRQAPAAEALQQCDLRTALERQRTYLLKKSPQSRVQLNGLSFTRADQLQVLAELERWLELPQRGFPHFRSYQVAGKDGRGNVQFTGYFSPKMQVRSTPNAEYRFPIYATPKTPGPHPTRDQIDYQGALQGRGLELAYANNLLDPFFMQIQGSGLVEFIDSGERFTFAYADKNGHAYYSIGRYMVEQGYLSAAEVSLESIKKWLIEHPERQREVLSLNPSYVFFKPTRQLPTGASGQPVTAYCSVAVDPKIIPYGSSVLIKRPVLDAKGEFSHHQTSVFFAQDRGGAIKGPGRVDIYTGIGEQAQASASALKHYGAMWLLLPGEPRY